MLLIIRFIDPDGMLPSIGPGNYYNGATAQYGTDSKTASTSTGGNIDNSGRNQRGGSYGGRGYAALNNDGNNYFATCPTCPDGAEYDIYRESSHPFAYSDGIVYSDILNYGSEESRDAFSWFLSSSQASSGGLNNFADGFGNADESNLDAPSSIAGIFAIEADAAKASIRHHIKSFSKVRSDKAMALRGMKYASIAGKSFGLAGAILTGFEGASDDNGFTVGDGVKVGIGVLTAFGPLGWAYGLVDLGVGITTGTTLTDRIGAGIDNAIKEF